MGFDVPYNIEYHATNKDPDRNFSTKKWKLKKNSSTGGPTTKRGEGDKGRTTKEKITFFEAQKLK